MTSTFVRIVKQSDLGGAFVRRLLTFFIIVAWTPSTVIPEQLPTVSRENFDYVVAVDQYRYAASSESGIFVSSNRGETWQHHSIGLPHRIIYPFSESPPYDPITFIGVDPCNPSRVAITTSNRVYLSETFGISWEEIPTSQPVRKISYFTSVAPSPHDPNSLLLGTSFHGVYETTDRGENWQHMAASIRFLAYDAIFYEEVTALSYDPSRPAGLILLAGFDGGIYYNPNRYADRPSGSKEWWHWFPVPVPGTSHIQFAPSNNQWVLRAANQEAQWQITSEGTWELADKFNNEHKLPNSQSSTANEKNSLKVIIKTSNSCGSKVFNLPTTNVESKASTFLENDNNTQNHSLPDRKLTDSKTDKSNSKLVITNADRKKDVELRDQASQRFGIYLSAWQASSQLPQYLEFLQQHDLNSFVVDLKDDNGNLNYDSNVTLAHELGAIQDIINVEELVTQAHDAGIYVIARIVVFKDKYLYPWQDYRLAVWDEKDNSSWKNLIPKPIKLTEEVTTKTSIKEHEQQEESKKRSLEEYIQNEFWVDPFSIEVWRYNVAIASELVERGVDEIQFDYIRFPSDGPTENAIYRHQRPGMTKIDAIESFLALAREQINIPISTDLFGFNSWHRTGNWIGQNIERISNYVDVISPMFYPSHFPHHFLADNSYLERARIIYERGVHRAQQMVKGRSYIRPYIQAFLIGHELRMEEKEYSRYLINQIVGSQESNASGFTLWNASNRYYMVNEPLQPYFKISGETVQ